MMQILRGDELSAFRKDLTMFLHAEAKSANGKYYYSTATCKMIYKLPYFYEYDTSLYSMFGSESVTLKRKIPKWRALEDGITLTFKNKLRTHRRKDATLEYWFQDTVGDMVMLSIETKNPLLPIFDERVKNELTIKANLISKQKDLLEYLQIKDWTF